MTMIGHVKPAASNGVSKSDHDMEWLARTLGPAPRDIPLWEDIWTLVKSKCSSTAEIDVWALRMRIKGMALWGIRIKADRDAYDPASKQPSFYGLVLLAPKLPVSLISSHLWPVAEAIWKLTGTFDPDWSDEVQDFMRWVDDDLVQGWEERMVPSEISGGIDCILTTGLFRKADMLGGAMAIKLMPILYNPGKKVATLVPPRYWSASYKTEWLTELDRRLNCRKNEEEAPASFIAFEVTGLPPASLIDVEALLEERCQKNKVECCFLNTGKLQDSERNDIPSSGELQFLGMLSQNDDILHTLGETIDQTVPTELRASIKVRSMNLTEFFERFDWFLEELRNAKNPPSDS